MRFILLVIWGVLVSFSSTAREASIFCRSQGNVEGWTGGNTNEEVQFRAYYNSVDNNLLHAQVTGAYESDKYDTLKVSKNARKKDYVLYEVLEDAWHWFTPILPEVFPKKDGGFEGLLLVLGEEAYTMGTIRMNCYLENLSSVHDSSDEANNENQEDVVYKSMETSELECSFPGLSKEGTLLVTFDNLYNEDVDLNYDYYTNYESEDAAFSYSGDLEWLWSLALSWAGQSVNLDTQGNLDIVLNDSEDCDVGKIYLYENNDFKYGYLKIDHTCQEGSKEVKSTYSKVNCQITQKTSF